MDPFERRSSIARTPPGSVRVSERTGTEKTMVGGEVGKGSVNQEKRLQARFLVIQRVDDGDFFKVSPFGIHKALNGLVGELKQIRKIKQGLLVETVSAAQSGRLQTVTKILDFSVMVSSHMSLNTARGVVYNRELLCYTEEEILQELKTEGRQALKKRKRFESRDPEDTSNIDSAFAAQTDVEKLKKRPKGWPKGKLRKSPNLRKATVKVIAPEKFTLCSLYLPDVHWNVDELNLLVEQLPRPFVLMGDFNAHNDLWGSLRIDTRGRDLEKWLDRPGIACINKGSKTHFNTISNTFSAIALIIVTSQLLSKLAWSVDEDLQNSDHFPVLIKSEKPNNVIASPIKWNTKKADWKSFAEKLIVPQDLTVEKRYQSELKNKMFRKRVVTRQLQISINKIMENGNKVGFTFSQEKTQCINFCRLRKPHYDPVLYMENRDILCSSSVKFLGLILDSKLTWQEHISSIVLKCKKSLNVLKVLAGTKWGADPDCLLNVYKAIILSKIDYGCFAYSSARKSQLMVLNKIQNLGIRYSLSLFPTSFPTTPISSLYCEAGVLPLEHRRKLLINKYLTGVKLNPKNPNNTFLFREDNTFFNRPTITRPLAIRSAEYLRGINMEFPENLVEDNSLEQDDNRHLKLNQNFDGIRIRIRNVTGYVKKRKRS
ncbi:hypothetical protein NQ315_011265 [Exocentrus adspersus]|uniref:Endonuclease/exonuclease/phosphatase domain-containing protein n=1 Tax=Exocentrus adspersus TaxID=1586481 RepID=A0AAV8VAF1_9CUCU|nr:hypothetical protein NQ315_011265 [Exocentrus adspersus]